MQFFCLAVLQFLLTIVFTTSASSSTQALPDLIVPPKDQETAYTSIQRTLYLFSTAVDTKTYSLFDEIFTADVTANFSVPGTTSISGLPHLKTVLGGLLSGLVSQHSLTNLVVDFQSPNSANSTQYLTTTFFGQGNLAETVLTNYGMYVDELEKQGDGRWLVSRRELVNTVSGF